ncbi:MAG: hypothetical protein CVU57_20385 [Deltaproteobacteria bacterium HGW-Deltaproteobacteria-15]|nr:MAG: hypothetical protein CVU57_20385 [Deltaproteobacteria bacterium HGW-Deltaproteobacteria-15]
MRLITLLVLVLVLVGCGASYRTQGLDAYKKGDMTTAEKCFSACYTEDPVCANDLGVVYWKTGRKQAAIDLWNYAARQGESSARGNLLNAAKMDPPPVDPYYSQGRQGDRYTFWEALLLGGAAESIGYAIGAWWGSR